jgi:cell division protein FtsX
MIWLLEGLRLLGRSRARSLLLVLCWTLALTLAGLAGWAWRGSPQLRAALTRRVPAECYLADDGAATLAGVRAALAAGRGLEWAGLLDAGQAAGEFRAGFGVDVVELLGENPFPPTVLLRVRPEAGPAQLERELAALRRVPGVTGVYLDQRLLGELGRQLRRAGWLLLGTGALLALLTLGLLALAMRGLWREWQGVARLLALHGARPWQLAVPPLVALFGTALVAAALSWVLAGVLSNLMARLGLAGISQGWTLFVGAILPTLLSALAIAAQSRRRVRSPF